MIQYPHNDAFSDSLNALHLTQVFWSGYLSTPTRLLRIAGLQLLLNNYKLFYLRLLYIIISILNLKIITVFIPKTMPRFELGDLPGKFLQSNDSTIELTCHFLGQAFD